MILANRRIHHEQRSIPGVLGVDDTAEKMRATESGRDIQPNPIE
jgi:hypothetical protein